MNAPQPPDPASAASPRRHRPPWVTSLIVVLAPALLALALAAGAAHWIYTTTSGLRALVAVAGLLSPRISAQGLQGSLRSGFSAESIAIEAPGWTVHATGVEIEPHELRWAERRIDLERVVARTVVIEWVANDAPAARPPTSLAIPVDLHLRAVSISTLQAGARDAQPTVVRSIKLAGRLNGEKVTIERSEFLHGRTRVAAAGFVDARPPFALQADTTIASSLREHEVGARVRASGVIEQIQLEVNADSDETRINARVALTPFGSVPLARLTADVAGFDPALWFDGVPTMRLRGTADLKPRDGPEFTLSGPFAVSNEIPGPIDARKLPVRSARGTLTWSASSLALAVDRLEGVRGTARGSFEYAQGGIDASARVAEFDASTVHTALVATSVEGTLTYRMIDATHRFVGSLRNVRGVALAADVDLTLHDEVVAIDSARLRLAGGKAELGGRVELRDRRAVRINGGFANLDLAQLINGIDTRLTGRIDVDGHLEPSLAGSAHVELADSSILGRPLTARATVKLAQQQFDADIDARSGAAHLTAQGGLGGGKELSFELIAPQLAQLLPEYAGGIEARGTVRGDVSSPTLQLTAVADGLALPGGHRVQHIDASLVGGLAPDAVLAVMAKLSGHRSPSGGADTSIAGATLVGRGTTADHSFELNAATVSQQPMRAVTSGGWRDGAWHGSLVAAETGRPLELRLRTPAALVVGPQAVSLGPADFELRGAKFTAVELRRRDSRWRSSGNFDGLQPQALDARARAPRRVVRSGAGDRTPLTMRGHWELDLGDSLSGVAIVERTDGDLYGGVDAQDPIGISGLGAAINVLDNRVTGTVYVRGKALGRLDAIIDAHLDTSSGLRLAQERPFRIDIDSVLPDLGWIGPLIGDSVQVGGSGTIRATVSGTPGDPTASGEIRGEAMRLAWVEQGVRLEEGRLDAKLEEGVLVIDELVFTGTPRVLPDEKRALEAVNFDAPGHVSAVGRVALRSLTGSIGVKADRLPILLRRDRWMVVSGEGGITLTPARADLYAKVQVDGAYIDFSGLRGPRTLPGDVVVVRAEQPRRAASAPPVEVTLDVEGRLGRRFYIRGAGLEARLAGQVEVSGRPGALKAAGTVRTVDGTYTGYGQRLQIERGIVTFQGAPENPALNVLAVRTGLPVEVGVAIGGTALKPLVRLHSDPAMSDIERLNWLVLGRPPGGSADGTGQDRALLTAAASALLAGQGDSASANLMRSLGIDEISLRPGQDSTSILPRETVAGTLRSATGTTAASEFVAIGKRISDDLYLTFEQALSGAAYHVALSYQLSRRLSLVARAGSTNALDLVYSFAFD